MANEQQDKSISEDRAAIALSARRLLRAARAATLATSGSGQPFASLVIPAIAADGAVLLLLSDLSEHTRHLRADPRCSLLMLAAAAADDPHAANPQSAPRVTVTGLAVISDTPADRARFLAIHPYAALYAQFGDFHLWRVRPDAGLLVAGFARAHRLRAGELAPAAAAAISAAGADIIAHCNTDHADAMTAIAQEACAQEVCTRKAGAPAGAWRMVTVDPDGCDLALGETVIRIDFRSPAADPSGVRMELTRLARAAREKAALDRPPGNP